MVWLVHTTGTVTNELGSDSREVVAVGKGSHRSIVKCLLNAFLTGIILSGLDEPLTVGQSATIRCMINIQVTSIEWRNQTYTLASTVNNMVEYTIYLVTDDLQGMLFICVAMAGATKYSERVVIQVKGSPHAEEHSTV